MTRCFIRPVVRFICKWLKLVAVMNCRQVRSSIYRSLEGGLTPRQQKKLTWHLWMCRFCFSRYEFARLMRIVTRHQITRHRAPARLHSRIRRLTSVR